MSTHQDTTSAEALAPAGWVASLRSATWTDCDSFVIHGWSFVRADEFTAFPTDMRVFLRNPQTSETFEAEVERWTTDEPNVVSANADVDRSFSAFRARFDFGAIAGAGSAETWVTHVAFGTNGRQYEGPFRKRQFGGSAAVMRPSVVDGHTLISPHWAKQRGLVFTRAVVPAIATSSIVDSSQVTIRVDCLPSFTPVSANLVDYDNEDALAASVTVDPTGSYRVVSPLPREVDPGHRWRLHLMDATGATTPLHWEPHVGPQAQPSSSATVIRRDELARVVIDTDSPPLLIEHVDVVDASGTEPVLRLGGRLRPGHIPALSLGLVGPRRSTWAHLVTGTDNRFVADVPLTQAAPLLPSGRSTQRLVIPSADYHLVARDEDRPGAGEDLVPELGEEVRESLYRTVGSACFNLRLEHTDGAVLRVMLRPPRGDDEVGHFHTRRLNAEDREHVHHPADAAYFESFFGDHVACNPLALHDEYAHRFPDHTRYWGIRDYSVSVPEGAVPVVIGSRAWRQARSRSRLLVVNDWLRHFTKKPHQTVVQTWHGTPYKKLALDRPGRRDDEEFVASVARQVNKWDYLVSQNAFMTEALRSSYAPPSRILEIGYPRNDRLESGLSDDARIALRAQLGIDPDKKVILYAPTRRETDKTMVRLLDFAQLVLEVGDDYVLLVRGHVTALSVDRNLDVRGVVDVTSYPDVTDLFELSDLMITDYSSVMFDYANTSKPMLFFVPDMHSYVTEQRGVYFDLAEIAPGPLLTTTEQIVSALVDLDRVVERYQEPYQSWAERFVPHDDGTVAAKILDIVLGTETEAGP